jgi:hypothetical protein
MALVSTFELLVKPIAPAGTGPAAVARTVVQGYFLTVANTSNVSANLRLQFTATTPSIDLIRTATFFDVNGNNVKGDLTATSDPRKFTYNFTVPAHDTALVSLLPDLIVPGVLASRNLEIRGYVEIFRASFFGSNYELLLTPEHRGTFLPQNLNAATPDFDQLAYALPTANGSSFYRLNSFVFPGDLTSVISGQANSAISTSDMQQMFSIMAERMEQLEQQVTVR